MSNSKEIRYACIDGINYAVKGDIKYLMECKRGFLYGKDRKPEVVVFGKNEEWTPKKVTLHTRSEKFKSLWPLRIDENGRPHDWQKRVFETSTELYNPNLPLVDCTE